MWCESTRARMDERNAHVLYSISLFHLVTPTRIFRTTHLRTITLTMIFRNEGGHCLSGCRGSTPCTERWTYRHSYRVRGSDSGVGGSASVGVCLSGSVIGSCNSGLDLGEKRSVGLVCGQRQLAMLHQPHQLRPRACSGRASEWYVWLVVLCVYVCVWLVVVCVYVCVAGCRVCVCVCVCVR